MKRIAEAHGNSSLQVVLSKLELLALNNALNEVCHGIAIEEREFRERIGADRSIARTLLGEIGVAFESLDGDL